jgi:magnesium-protoporphyrin O-methyltransferase
MRTPSYLARRGELTTYFDKTAAKAWKALTSTDPVGRVRATVRAGRDAMRANLLDWLPDDLEGQTLLDAGCGTGALAVEAARRGASVVAIDVASNLIDVAKKRAAELSLRGEIDFRVGDMLGDAPSSVDFVVAMDSLIHYGESDVRAVVGEFCRRASGAVLFTTAPWTPALAAMHVAGRLIPHRHHRAPAIVPMRVPRLTQRLDTELEASGWQSARTRRITSGFYISQAVELTR